MVWNGEYEDTDSIFDDLRVELISEEEAVKLLMDAGITRARAERLIYGDESSDDR